MPTDTGNERSTEEKGKTAAERQTPANRLAKPRPAERKCQTIGRARARTRGAKPMWTRRTSTPKAAPIWSNDRAARIADTLMATATPRSVNANVHVGAPLPGDVELMPLPPTIVDLVPEYRDYDYVVVNDEIVIVQPSTRQVVEVINTCGGEAMNVGGPQAMAGTRLNPRATP